MNGKKELRDAKTRFAIKKVPRVEFNKIRIRGDEVAVLFFSLVFLAFLFISFFRLFAIGKLFDDFIFLFLFGWIKYLVYFVLFSIVLPLCFNYYLKLKWTFVLALFFTFIVISWLVANIILIMINSVNSNVSIWKKVNVYDFNQFRVYFQTWWNSTIINNYHGFFAHPLSFDNWTKISSFFPPFASGGVIANVLIALFSRSYFIINWVLSLVALFIALSWVIFGKPWILFIGVFLLFKPLKTYLKKRRIERISEKSERKKERLNAREDAKNQLNPVLLENKPVSENSNKPYPPGERYSKKSLKKENNNMKDMIQESGTLTPFGQLNQELEEKIYEKLTQKLEELTKGSRDKDSDHD